MKLIELDGSAGGGQMLRTALTLAMVTGKPFRMTNIRGKRRKPGLMRQHLTCVKAACEISEGSADGAEMGSTELVFRAGKLRHGKYEFAIGTAGSTGLLFQTLLPALSLAGGESRVRLTGGTHNPLAPPFDFLDQVFLPAMRRIGYDASLDLVQTGFAPAGGGVIDCTIRVAEKLTPLHLSDRGVLISSSIRVPVRGLPPGIAERVLAAALDAFPCEDSRIHGLPDGPGQGVLCLVESRFEHAVEMVCTFGEMNVSSEKVGRRAGRAMRDFIDSGVPVGRYLADQLLLPMALAGGGEILTLKSDDHVPTNIDVIQKFLPVQFEITRPSQGRRKIICHAESVNG